MQDATENKYAVTGWKRKTGDDAFDFTLPSGQVCLIKKLRMETIAELGLMNDLDSFTGAIIPEPSKKAKGKGAKALTQEEQERESAKVMLKDKESFNRMLVTINKVVVACVVEPKVHVEPEGDRDEDLVYTDDIDFEDKMLIFQEVFEGMSSLESFRKGSSDIVGTVAKVTSVKVPAQPAPELPE